MSNTKGERGVINYRSIIVRMLCVYRLAGVVAVVPYVVVAAGFVVAAAEVAPVAADPSPEFQP